MKLSAATAERPLTGPVGPEVCAVSSLMEIGGALFQTGLFVRLRLLYGY